jgi:hypothetical protein
MKNRIHKVSNISFENSIMKIKIDNKLYQFEIQKISTKLFNAASFERENFKISPSGYGIHWPIIDEDLSIKGLLKMIENNIEYQIS